MVVNNPLIRPNLRFCGGGRTKTPSWFAGLKLNGTHDWKPSTKNHRKVAWTNASNGLHECPVSQTLWFCFEFLGGWKLELASYGKFGRFHKWDISPRVRLQITSVVSKGYNRENIHLQQLWRGATYSILAWEPTFPWFLEVKCTIAIFRGFKTFNFHEVCDPTVGGAWKHVVMFTRIYLRFQDPIWRADFSDGLEHQVPIGSMGLVFLPTSTIKTNQISVNILYMDPMVYNYFLANFG